jgi:hypothetical protein
LQVPQYTSGPNIVLDEAPVRRVFLHFHLMKNAGSTIAAILAREFTDGYREVHRPSADGRIDAAGVLASIGVDPTIRAISSHHLRFPLADHPDVVFFDCCPLRHPIDRLVSLYVYHRNVAAPEEPLSTLARATTLGDFLEMLLDRQPNFIHNVQTTLLGNRGRFRVLAEDDLLTAERTVRRSAAVAVTHRMDESLVVAEYFLGPAFPGLRLHSPPLNVTRPIVTDLAARERAVRDEIGEDTYGRLERANEYDLRLLATAEAELDRRLAVVPNLQRRLEDYRARCR